MIIISTYATKRYAYALPNFGRRLAATLSASQESGGLFLFVGDQSDIIEEKAYRHIAENLPSGWDFELMQLPIEDSNLKNYKEDAQLLIAQMQSAAMTKARQLRASIFWSLESDVLVPHNAFSVSLDILNFDEGYYDIAMCSYPSQGGGAFLGGRGDYRHQIGTDFEESERDVPDELLERKKKHDELGTDSKNRTDDWMEVAREIDKEIKNCPPVGNVYELNGKHWRARGWMEYAYPAIGKGAIVPTDWVGMGCTMLSEKALSMAHFDGYEGKGTQDLYLGWTRWKPNGLNMCVTTHAVCDHVIRRRDGDDQLWDNFEIVSAYHEPEGDYIGHLRQRNAPLYTFEAGEKSVKKTARKPTKKK